MIWSVQQQSKETHPRLALSAATDPFFIDESTQTVEIARQTTAKMNHDDDR